MATLPHDIFPAELMGLIFEQLAAERDWATLGTCAVLSHRYFRHARTCLFSCITLKMRNYPEPILIHNVVRRIRGLDDMFKRDPVAAGLVKRFTILDSYPVYDSQWITQQSSLPRLINRLTGVQECTFGCEVGYLQWGLLSPELATSLENLFSQPLLERLTLCNIGGIPYSIFNISARHLNINNITVAPTDSFLYPRSQLSYLSLRTLSVENTHSAWELMKGHSKNIKLIRWRCWEDPQARDGTSFPGAVDLGRMPALQKLVVRMSFGKVGRDLSGFCDLLEAVTHRSPLRVLELSILFPHQAFPATMPEVHGHTIWTRLAVALLRIEYRELRRVTMELTVHEKVRVWNGRRENSLMEFRKQMRVSLRALANISTFHFKFRVRPFPQ